MKLLLTTAFLGLSLLFTGCLNTFYPIFTERDLVWNDNLVGKWQFKDKELHIRKIGNPALLPKHLKPFQDKILQITEFNEDNIESGTDIALVVKIGNHYFLDRFPVLNNAERSLNTFYSSLLLRQHTVYRVDSFETGKKLYLQRVSDKMLNEQIEQKKIRIETVKRDDGTLILANTSELQKHIIKYAGNESFYENDNSYSFKKIAN